MTERGSDQRAAARSAGRAAANLVCVLAVLWWNVGDASRAESRRRYQAALVADVIPLKPLVLHGNIRLIGIKGEWEPASEAEPIPGQNREFRMGCDAVCAALLALPDVDSVTIIDESRRRGVWRFRLVAKELCNGPSVVPQHPDSLLPRRAASEKASGVTVEERLETRMVETSWRVRLSLADCIIADEVGTVSTFTIRNETRVEFGDANWRSNHEDWAWTFDALPVSIRRLEIRDSQGEVRFRRSFTSTPMLSNPPLPGTVTSTGTMGFPVYGWSREKLQNFGLTEEYNAQTLLIEHTNIADGIQTTYPI